MDFIRIESNLRQRVLGNTNPVELGRCFRFINNWYRFERGGSGYYGNQHEEFGNNFVTPKTEKQ